VEAYLREVRRRLRVDPAMEKAILAELRSHLEEATIAHQAMGLSRERAEARAIKEFGEAWEVAKQLQGVHGSSFNQALLAAFLPVVLTIVLKWVAIPLLRLSAAWQVVTSPAFLSVAALLLLLPTLRWEKWRYGLPAWGFFWAMTILELAANV
jgi:hypothetical protein